MVGPKLVRNYCDLPLLYSQSTDFQIESTSVSSYENDVVANGSAGGKQSGEDVAFAANGKSGLQIAVSAPWSTSNVSRLTVVSGCTYTSDHYPS